MESSLKTILFISENLNIFENSERPTHHFGKLVFFVEISLFLEFNVCLNISLYINFEYIYIYIYIYFLKYFRGDQDRKMINFPSIKCTQVWI